MKATLIIASLFAAFAAASPVELEARQGSVRVQLSDDATETGVQANVAKNGARIPVRSAFGNLGNPPFASSGSIVSGSGVCNLFSNAAGTARVATFRSGGATVRFSRTNLQNGVIVCTS